MDGPYTLLRKGYREAPFHVPSLAGEHDGLNLEGWSFSLLFKVTRTFVVKLTGVPGLVEQLPNILAKVAEVRSLPGYEFSANLSHA